MNEEQAGGHVVLGGRYRLTGQVGAGGMAVVWQAFDTVLARTVAVKVLATRYAGDPQSRALIRLEAQSAGALSHPNVAQVYDYGETTIDGEPIPYVVMELIRGATLQQRLNDGPVPPRIAMRVCAEVAAGLAAAHAEGLVHRDIKPANVMLAATGAKVVDFGIAAAIRPPSPGADDLLVLGTPAYLAPERLLHDAVEPASDVYALGVMLYRLLADRSPWTSETTTQMLTAHIYVDPAPLTPTAGVPAHVIALCNRCLSKDPAMRPSARETAALLAHGAGLPIVTDEPPAPRPGPAVDPDPSVLIRPAGAAPAAVPGNPAAAHRTPTIAPGTPAFFPGTPAITPGTPTITPGGSTAFPGDAGFSPDTPAASPWDLPGDTRATGNGTPVTGNGVTATSGGVTAAGGAIAMTGGTLAAFGGVPATADGTPATGGSPPTPGGTPTAGGGTPTAGTDTLTPRGGAPGAGAGTPSTSGNAPGTGGSTPGTNDGTPGSTPGTSAGTPGSGGGATGAGVTSPARSAAGSPDPDVGSAGTAPAAAGAAVARPGRRRLLRPRHAATAAALLTAVAVGWALRPDDSAGPSSAPPPAGSAPASATGGPRPGVPVTASAGPGPATATRTAASRGAVPAASDGPARGGTAPGVPGPAPTGADGTGPAATGPAATGPAATSPAATGPAPGPTTGDPAPATTATATTRTLSSSAGSVRATCPAADTAQILDWTAARSYRVVDADDSPGPAPAVTFKHGNTPVTMTVTCSSGVPSATTES